MNVRLAWVGAVALGAVACGKVNTNATDGGGGGGDDGGALGADGGGGGGGGGGLELLAGTWDFTVDDGGGTSCEVTIDDAGGYAVSCPFDSVIKPGTTCQETSNAFEIQGTWLDEFTGEARTHRTFEGVCSADETRTVEFVMAAAREAAGAGPGFLDGLAGTWAWRAHDPSSPAESDGLGCSVSLTPTPTQIDYFVSCPSEPGVYEPGCTRAVELRIDGRIEPTFFTGTIASVETFEPAGCGLPAPAETISLSAYRR